MSILWYNRSVEIFIVKGVINADILCERNLRRRIIELSLSQYGKGYVHGRNGPDSFDCAGFAWFIYNEIFNINLYSGGIGKSTTTKIMTSSYGSLRLFNEESLNKELSLIKCGDILFFHRQSLNESLPKDTNRYPGHCGIYLGGNFFIQSSSVKRKVIISSFDNNSYWKKVLVGSKDILDDSKVLRRFMK